MKVYPLVFLFMILNVLNTFATGEPATRFNIFIPPNNDATRRDVCLIVTAIYDSTSYEIIDDNMDGDTDDSHSGMLMAGQSYILYIRDNGINDDASGASTGTLRQDGDYFIINSDKAVLASQSTDSDWQHDWVPAVSGTGIGTKFLIYAPKITSSPRDINVIPYTNNTTVTIKRISTTATTTTGNTAVDVNTGTIVCQLTMNVGQDMIFTLTNGRDLMQSGHTYLIETNQPVTLQYGALWGNSRDGGGYVPSSNGSSAGELFYFTVPYQTTTEQEVRIVSWDDNNIVSLDRWVNGAWVNIKNFNPLNRMKAGEWVGKTNGQTYPNVFRAKCTAGKKISVFEANWLETGSPGTSDIATMASADNGKSSGKNFLVYMAPPGNEQNITNVFTRAKYTQATHAYIFANRNEIATVTVKDANTNGTKINQTFTIQPGRYYDFYLDLAKWKNIYNGTGTASGSERPYLEITSSEEISVMISNHNDNWMMYFGSSQVQYINQNSGTSTNTAIPGDVVTITNTIEVTSAMQNADIEIIVGSGLVPVSSTLTNTSTATSYVGQISVSADASTITYPTVNTLQTGTTYEVVTEVVPQVTYNNGLPVPNNAVLSVSAVVTATVATEIQQSTSTEGITNNSSNTSNLLFSYAGTATPSLDKSNGWTCNWVDYDGDGDDDLFICDQNRAKQNVLYRNDGGSTFTKITSGIFGSSIDRGPSIAASWADIDNDGDLDFYVANNLMANNFLYKNNGSGSFTRIINDPSVSEPGYDHGAAFADYDNDGYVDLFVSDYMPVSFNKLYRNQGDGTFVAVKNSVITSDAGYSIGSTWADYDNDGDVDLFVPNDRGENNSLYRNDGRGTFVKLSNSIVCNDGGHSVASCWGDYDNDKDLDLFVANANGNAFLYRYEGNDVFTKITNVAPVNAGNSSMHGCNWVDVDNDGDLDLYVVANNKAKWLYMNNGDGTFLKKTNEIINSSMGNTYGQAWSDFDKDGDMDLYLPTIGTEANYLMTCNGNDNHWLSIKLQGVRSNRSAIGAKIYAKCTYGGVTKWQTREVNAQSGIGGQSSYRQHFGVGEATLIDSIIVKWPSGITQVLTAIPAQQHLTLIEPNSSEVSGKVFFDANNNCVLDAGEVVIPTAQLLIQPGNIRVNTDAQGYYSVDLTTGNYVLSVEEDQYWTSHCANVNVSVLAVGQQYSNQNVGIVNNGASQSNLSIHVSASAQRRGFHNQIRVHYTNYGNSDAGSTVLHLELSPEMHMLSSTTPVSRNNGQVYEWDLNSISKGTTGYIEITDSVGLSAQLESTLNIQASLITAMDADPSDNTMILSVPVVGAVDPNDIVVTPVGEGEGHWVSKNTEFTYRINFQNVGNYPAELVKIINVIPAHLDISTLQLLGSSHTCQVVITERQITWTFPSIQLPDSSHGESSNGYVEYKIKGHPDLAAGTRISNQAAIYFDYNEPLITNTVFNTIQQKETTRELQLSPNPISDRSDVLLSSTNEMAEEKALIFDYTISDFTGKIVRQESVGGILQLEITRGDLSPGLYILNVIDEKGERYSKTFMIR